MKNLCLMILFSIAATLYSSDRQWESYKQRTLPELSQIHGWCTQEKAIKMMDLIYKTKPALCVEIGVFGGSSIYPTAKALLYHNCGKVYAIDPWSKEDCTEGYDPEDPNYGWWDSVDLEAIYTGFIEMLTKYKLEPYCTVMRMTSLQACDAFEDESIDILHIDGNHSEDSALTDAMLYLPKVKKGGYIWFDDVNWSSTTMAILFLCEHCDMVEELSLSNCILFQKNALTQGK